MLIGVLLLGVGSTSALYVRSDTYQKAITTPQSPQIIVVKKKPAAATQTNPAPTASADTTPAPVATSSTPKTSNTSSDAFMCKDKANVIYITYNKDVAVEYQKHQDIVAGINEDYEDGVYDIAALYLNDGTTPEQLRDEDLADETARWNTATYKLADDERAQMNATGCFSM